jgi:hypothetical protein
VMATARERWNAIRKPKAKPPEHPPGPSSVVMGTPGDRETLERWGMIPAFDDDDPFDRRVRGY